MRKIINVKTDKLFTNITKELEDFVKDQNGDGLVNAFITHTTCSLRILEDEILHQVDIRWFLDHTFPMRKPDNRRYAHDLVSLRQEAPIDERINAFSHMRSLFFNTSETIPVQDGKLLLGEWQSIFFIELDPIRDRKIILTYQ